MRVALGTFELDDTARKAISKELGIKRWATREDVREWALDRLNKSVDTLVNPPVAAVSAPAEVTINVNVEGAQPQIESEQFSSGAF